MTDHKFTDEQIIKALETCNDSELDCNKCPYNNNRCVSILERDALDLIKRQKAEIERLQEENRRMKKYYYTHDYHECHNEAIKDFADKLKKELTTGAAVMRVSTLDIIDCLVKELTEEKNDAKM